MIEEDPKLEPVMAPSTNFAEEFRSQVIPCIQTALLGSSELEVTDLGWRYMCVPGTNYDNCLELSVTLEREMKTIAGPCDCLPGWEGA